MKRGGGVMGEDCLEERDGGDESALPFLVTEELKTPMFTSLQTPEPLCVCLCSLSP